MFEIITVEPSILKFFFKFLLVNIVLNAGKLQIKISITKLIIIENTTLFTFSLSNFALILIPHLFFNYIAII